MGLPAAESGGRRKVRLGPGEFVGGSFADLTLRFASPGRYQVVWAAALSWNDKPFTIPAAPLAVDRK